MIPRKANLARFDPRSIAARANDIRFRDRRFDDTESDADARSIPQPFMPENLPHNVLDPRHPHDNGAFTFDEEEGDTVLPEPCWDQYPGDGNERRHYYNPTKQWGDRRIIAITDLSQVPSANVPVNQGGQNPSQTTSSSPNTTTNTGQLLDLKIQMPTVCLVRLSAVDLTGQLTSTAADLFVIWTVDIGCGRSLQRKFYKQLVAPLLGQVETQLLFQIPLQALRASCEVFDTFAALSKVYEVECLVAAAPFTSYPDIVSP